MWQEKIDTGIKMYNPWKQSGKMYYALPLNPQILQTTQFNSKNCTECFC